MKPAVVIQSDCSAASTRTAILTGVIETISADTDVAVETVRFEKNNVPPVSAYLYTTVPFWPSGTVFLSDTGDKEQIAARLATGQILVGPNDGFLSLSAFSFGLDEARYVDTEKFGNDGLQAARACAALANGESFESLGKTVPSESLKLLKTNEAVIEEGLAEGEVGMLLKTFGNITFNIRTDDFEKTKIVTGDAVKVTFTCQGNTVYEETMTYQPSFGYVEEGAPVIFNGSSGYMDIGLNRRNFIEECLPQILAAEDPSEYKVRIEKLEESR